jgi:hypothetical protein
LKKPITNNENQECKLDIVSAGGVLVGGERVKEGDEGEGIW